MLKFIVADRPRPVSTSSRTPNPINATKIGEQIVTTLFHPGFAVFSRTRRSTKPPAIISTDNAIHFIWPPSKPDHPMIPALWITPQYESNRRNKPNSSWHSHDGPNIQRCHIAFKDNSVRSTTGSPPSCLRTRIAGYVNWPAVQIPDRRPILYTNLFDPEESLLAG